MSITRREFIKAVAATGLSSTIVGCAIPAMSVRQRQSFDLVIKNGGMIDGTGTAERPADIGIRDGRILAIGNLDEATADRVIDASGLTVVPGFIDIHSHVDVELFRDPRAESKVHQGVTTEVNGCDGDSPAPLGGPGLDRDLADFKEQIGFDCPYRDMDGFFSLLEQRHSAQNIVSLIGLGSIRGLIVGEENRPATPDELARMQREVVRGIEQGCRGTSTGLEYTPGSFATPDELIELVRVAPEKYRLYATHMRNEDNRLLEAIDEAITIARGSGGRLQVSHLKASYKVNWYKQEKALKMLDDAIASGVDVHADRYPYVAYATDLDALFPLWAREGGTEAFLSRLKSADDLKKMREAVLKKIDSLGSWASVMISEVHTDGNKKYQGKTIEDVSKETGQDPFDVTIGLLEQENGRVSMVGFGMDEAGTEMVLAWKNTMICSDASSFSPSHRTSQPHPRAYGSFPRAIARYQRERKIVTLPEMIRKMTSLPASQLGLTDRGVLSVGNAADIVIFDYATIEDRATYLDPHQFPVGIPYVLVNGVPVVDQGVQTSALPGRVLRST
ncbi:MAG TPA: D-aminoacylase [Spirochaetia bacterium]|nr:D-aminoacylase [Spirochaetia bacterium]